MTEASLVSGFFVLLLFLASLLSVVTSDVALAPRIVGVQAGEWFRYVCSFDTNVTGPQRDEATESYYEILEVINTNITCNATWLYPGNHYGTHVYHIDVDTGIGDTFWFIATNLGPGDVVYTNTTNPYFQGAKIDETLNGNYLNQTFELNHLSGELQYDAAKYNATFVCDYFDLYWFRSTGVLAEFVDTTIVKYENGSSYFSTVGSKICERGVIPEFPSFLVMPLFMIATLLAVIVYRRKHTGQLCASS